MAWVWSWRRFALQIDVAGLLRPYISGEFLALSVIVGYLLFFFFFYSTEEDSLARRHWESLEWSERFFFGLLIGGCVLLVFSGGLSLILTFLLQRVVLQRSYNPVSLWVISSLVVVISVLSIRLEVRGAIYGPDGSSKIQSIVNHAVFRALFFWLPLHVLSFLAIVAYLSTDSYYVIGNSVRLLCVDLWSASLSFLLFSAWFFLLFLYALSALWSPMPGLSQLKEYVFAQVSRLRALLQSPSQILGVARDVVAMIVRNRKAFAAWGVVILFGIITPIADGQVGLFIPKVQYVETEYADSYQVIGTVEDYKVLIGVTKTFFITSPYIWLIRNITIANPSNSSYAEGTGWLQISSSLIGSNAGLSTIKGQEDRVVAFNVTLHPKTERYVIGLQTQYYDALDYHIMNATPSRPTDTGNGTSRQQISITIRNPLGKRLDFQTLLVMTAPSEVVVENCTSDGKVVNWCPLEHSPSVYLIIPTLDPGKSWNVVIVIEYKRQ
jgi:hypothetical protein